MFTSPSPKLTNHSSIIIACLLALLAGAGAFMYMNQNSPQTNQNARSDKAVCAENEQFVKKAKEGLLPAQTEAIADRMVSSAESLELIHATQTFKEFASSTERDQMLASLQITYICLKQHNGS
jgi:hypothetical protein